jgi:large subunit ribosomal protein L25
MTRIELPATLRKSAGKGSARRLRAKNLIPAVLYGPHTEKPLNIAVDPEALKEAISTPHKLNTLLTLKLEDGAERLVMIKDYQTEIVSHDLMHADFLDVRLDEKVRVKVPLIFAGMPAGVKEGGILQTMRRELELMALPTAIPEKIEVDVSHLKIGGSLHVKDVQFPSGVTPKFTTNFAIAAVVAPEKEEVAAPVAAAVEGAAAVPGAAPAAPGAAPGAPGAAPAAAGAAAPAAAGAGAKAPAAGAKAPGKEEKKGKK